MTPIKYVGEPAWVQGPGGCRSPVIISGDEELWKLFYFSHPRTLSGQLTCDGEVATNHIRYRMLSNVVLLIWVSIEVT